MNIKQFVYLLAMTLSANAMAQDPNFKKVQVRTMNGLKWGYVDTRTDKRVIEAKYDECQDFYDGITSVAINGKSGLIDTLGNEIIPLVNSKVWLLGEGMVAVSKSGNKFALANSKGQILTSETYDEFGSELGGFSGGFCSVRKLNKWAYIDKNGKQIGGFDYDKTEPFKSGIAKVGKKSGYQNMQFEAILNAGFINEKGVPITEIKYNFDKSQSFSDGQIALALDVKDAGKSGYVSTGSSYALLDKNGKTIIPFDRNYQFEKFAPDFILVSAVKSSRLKYGMVDWTGKEALPVNFAKIEFQSYQGSWIAKVFFDSSNYFYINDRCECFEYNGAKCPEK